MLHIPIVHAHDISKQIPREKNFPLGWKCWFLRQLCVHRDMKPLGSLESAQEAWSNSYAPFVLSKHPACFISRWTHADIWTIAKSQLTWIRIPSLTWRTVKSSLLAPYSGLVHRRASRGIKRRLIQVPNGIIFPSFLWEMHPHILLHNLRVTHATRILSVVYLF